MAELDEEKVEAYEAAIEDSWFGTVCDWMDNITERFKYPSPLW